MCNIGGSAIKLGDRVSHPDGVNVCTCGAYNHVSNCTNLVPPLNKICNGDEVQPLHAGAQGVRPPIRVGARPVKFRRPIVRVLRPVIPVPVLPVPVVKVPPPKVITIITPRTLLVPVVPLRRPLVVLGRGAGK
jgi:hypothetical protein